ncbi:hypothetical protein [Verrucosispora sp. NA02020]|uniref:hypothetical protein n=1 Tax=Verrucosispora sp. NA02020 TaxID=2742132 RepID=UPI003D748DFA
MHQSLTLVLLTLATAASVGLHISHGTTGSTILAMMLLAATSAWSTRLWLLRRQDAAEGRARAEEEAGWWSGPIPQSITGPVDADTVAFGTTVVPIATRRSRPDAGAQRAG